MHKLFLSVLIAGAMSCGTAFAMPVNVDFVGGSNVEVGTETLTVQNFPGASQPVSVFKFTAGTWQENGVDTKWRLFDDIEEIGELPSDPSTFNNFRNLSDSDPGADPFVARSMDISRTDGGSFNLSRIGAGLSYEGIFAVGQFTPEGGDFSQSVLAEFPVLGPSLKLTGKKPDGSTVEGTGTTKTPANWQGPGFVEAFFDPTEVMLTKETLAKFTGLTSLTLEIYDNITEYSTDAESRLAAIKTLLDFGAPSVLLEGLDQCGFRDCIIPGVGEYEFSLEYYGLRNDERNVFIGDFDLEFLDGPSPAPVPLPASALLLFAGLAALSAARLKRRA
jgi:hypothetical protein